MLLSETSRHSVALRDLVIRPPDCGSYRSHVSFLGHIGNFSTISGVDWVPVRPPHGMSLQYGLMVRVCSCSFSHVTCLMCFYLVVFLVASDCHPPSLPLLDHLGLEQPSAAQVGSSASRVGRFTAAHVGSLSSAPSSARCCTFPFVDACWLL